MKLCREGAKVNNSRGGVKSENSGDYSITTFGIGALLVMFICSVLEDFKLCDAT